MDSFAKKASALKESLDWLKEEGDASAASRNHAIATNETQFEIGVFDEPAKRNVDNDALSGFAVRTRREGLATHLNTIEILKSIDALSQKIERIEKQQKYYWYAAFGAAIGLYIRHFGLFG